MKIFKLKYLAVSLIVTILFGSCATDENLQEADKIAEEKGDFVIDRTMNYLINGALTYDYNAVKVAAADAWNVHFDYPNHKVVISTNLTEFEEYKNSNLEFKNALLKNDKAAIEDITKPIASNVTKAGEFGMHGGKHNRLNFPNTLVFHYNGANRHYIFPWRPIPNTQQGISIYYSDSSGDLQVDNAFIIKSSSVQMLGTNANKTYLVNTSNTVSYVCTLYNGFDYQGRSRSITLAKGGRVRMDNVKIQCPTGVTCSTIVNSIK